LTTLVWKTETASLKSFFLSLPIRLRVCVLKSRAMVGSRSRVIHSQIGTSEPRGIRPGLS